MKLSLGLDLASMVARGSGVPWWRAPENLLDGQAAALLADIGRQRFMLFGAPCAATDIISVSSDPKWVDAPDETLTLVPANTPAFVYDTASGFWDLPLEGASTNLVKANDFSGGIAGSPGTAPPDMLNWAPAPAGIVRVLNFGTEYGVRYADVRFYGTATGTSSWYMSFTKLSTQSVPITPGAEYCASVYMRLIAGSLNTLSSMTLRCATYNAGGTPVGEWTALDTKALTSALKRWSITSSHPTAVYAAPYVSWVVNAGYTIDFTIRFYLPQFEAGNLATSPIVTTDSSTATRVTDVCQLTPAAASVFQGAAATLAWRGSILTLGSANTIVGTNNRTLIRQGAADPSSLLSDVTSSVAMALGASGTLPGSVGIAVGYDAAGQVGSTNGQGPFASGTLSDRDTSSVFLAKNLIPGSVQKVSLFEAWQLRGLNASIKDQARTYV